MSENPEMSVLNPAGPAGDVNDITIFERMSRAAVGVGAINLGQGFPELPEADELIHAAQSALAGHSNQYPPMRGLPVLREAVADHYRVHQNLDITADNIVITSGATEALAATLGALIRPGDEVILIQPLYDAYRPLVEWAGGRVRLIDLAPPGWHLPLDAVHSAINPRTRAIVLNTPNNPTGTLIDAGTLAELGALCIAHDVILVCDEVWESTLWAADMVHHSLLAIPALRNHVVKIGSAGKIFAMTGWKVGWAVASPALAAKVANRHQFLTFTTATPLQWAVAEGLRLPPAWFAARHTLYQSLRSSLITGLAAAGYQVLPNAASWFILLDLVASGIMLDDVTFCERLIPEAGVAAIPVSAFYAERAPQHYVRLCFAKPLPVLADAVRRMARFRQQCRLSPLGNDGPAAEIP